MGGAPMYPLLREEKKVPLFPAGFEPATLRV